MLWQISFALLIATALNIALIPTWGSIVAAATTAASGAFVSARILDLWNSPAAERWSTCLVILVGVSYGDPGYLGPFSVVRGPD